MFLRKSRVDPLPVTMSAVRLGDRVLQIGVENPEVASAIAAKVGLSGSAAIAVRDDREAERAHSAAAHAGVLVDVTVTPPAPLPFDNDAFDLVVIHSTSGFLSSLDADARGDAMSEWRRVVRRGGRVMTIEAGPIGGLKGLMRHSRTNEAYDISGGTIAALETAGFKPVRMLAEREGYKFTEGIKS